MRHNLRSPTKQRSRGHSSFFNAYPHCLWDSKVYIRLTVFQLKIEVNKVSSSVKSKICQKVIDIHRGPRFWLLNGKILGGPIEISYEEVDCALPLVSSPHWWYVVSGSFAYCDGHSTKTTSRNKNLPINNATKRLHAERIHPHKDIQGLTKTYASPFPKKIQFHAWFGKNTPSGRSAMGRSINSLHADLKQRWRVKGWASITWPKQPQLFASLPHLSSRLA